MDATPCGHDGPWQCGKCTAVELDGMRARPKTMNAEYVRNDAIRRAWHWLGRAKQARRNGLHPSQVARMLDCAARCRRTASLL